MRNCDCVCELLIIAFFFFLHWLLISLWLSYCCFWDVFSVLMVELFKTCCWKPTVLWPVGEDVADTFSDAGVVRASFAAAIFAILAVCGFLTMLWLSSAGTGRMSKLHLLELPMLLKSRSEFWWPLLFC